MGNQPYINPKSLTFWTGIAAILFGGWQLYQGDTQGIETITGGMAVIGIRRAVGASGGLSRK